jgi:FHA domain
MLRCNPKMTTNKFTWLVSILFALLGLVSCQKKAALPDATPIGVVRNAPDLLVNKSVVLKGIPYEIDVNKGAPSLGFYVLRDDKGDRITVSFDSAGSPISGRQYIVEGIVVRNGDDVGLKEIRRIDLEEYNKQAGFMDASDWRLWLFGGLVLVFAMLLTFLIFLLIPRKPQLSVATDATQTFVAYPRATRDQIPTEDYRPLTQDLRTADYHGYIQIVEGPEKYKGQRFELVTRTEKGELSIGRGTDRDIQFDLPAISRQQARFVWKDGNIWLINDTVKNPTLVNGEKVTSQILKDGDRINMAGIEAIVRFS